MEAREGWGWPDNSRKAHYFVDGRSLCGKWMYSGEITPDAGWTSKDDCAECQRKAQKRLRGGPNE